MILWAIALFPMSAALISLALRRRSAVLIWIVAGSLVELVLALSAAARVFRAGAVSTLDGHIALDALSALHLCLVAVVSLLSSIYAREYFSHESESSLDDRTAWKFGGLWFAFIGSMVGVLLFNNVGLMWVSMESTTLASTFLICLHRDRPSMEAAWKYLIICSAGIMLGLLGTIFIYGASPLAGESALKWSTLMDSAAQMDPRPARIGFILILIGYGTKVGLAPMHTWLPDAHSQAPTPVSAMFSGVLLNCGFYCITRFVPIVSTAVGDPSWCRHMLLGFGLFSMLVASLFILGQRDLKRLLAYSSVEHMGIVAVGMGMGGGGTFAALYHTINHSVCKSLAFFCAGRTIQERGTRDIEKLSAGRDRVPVWGSGLLVALLALIGCAPFSIFMSEFLIVRAGVEEGQVAAVALFLLAAATVFAGALKPAISLAFGVGKSESRPPAGPVRSAGTAHALVGILSLVLIGLGVWIPAQLQTILHQAAAVIAGN